MRQQIKSEARESSQALKRCRKRGSRRHKALEEARNLQRLYQAIGYNRDGKPRN